MKSDIKDKIDNIPNLGGFIKVTDEPVRTLTPQQKVKLNRKGNELFNNGDIDTARRIFITTGYSDGLTRVGDVEKKDHNELKALKMYWLAHNKGKSEPIIRNLAALISTLLNTRN